MNLSHTACSIPVGLAFGQAQCGPKLQLHSVRSQCQRTAAIHTHTSAPVLLAPLKHSARWCTIPYFVAHLHCAHHSVVRPGATGSLSLLSAAGASAHSLAPTRPTWQAALYDPKQHSTTTQARYYHSSSTTTPQAALHHPSILLPSK